MPAGADRGQLGYGMSRQLSGTIGILVPFTSGSQSATDGGISHSWSRSASRTLTAMMHRAARRETRVGCSGFVRQPAWGDPERFGLGPALRRPEQTRQGAPVPMSRRALGMPQGLEAYTLT
jgi:hypothetical protein